MTVITHSLNINLETGRVLLIVFVLIYLTEQSSDWVILYYYVPLIDDETV